MRKKKIFIQAKVTIDLDNEDLEDFLLYLPECLTRLVTKEDVILEDELYDEDIKILDEGGKTVSIDDILKQRNMGMTKGKFYRKWGSGGTFNSPHSEPDKDKLDNMSTYKEFMADLDKVIEQEKM